MNTNTYDELYAGDIIKPFDGSLLLVISSSTNENPFLVRCLNLETGETLKVTLSLSFQVRRIFRGGNLFFERFSKDKPWWRKE